MSAVVIWWCFSVAVFNQSQPVLNDIHPHLQSIVDSE